MIMIVIMVDIAIKIKMIWVALVDYSTADRDNAAFFYRAMLTDQTIEEMEQQVFVVFILFL